MVAFARAVAASVPKAKGHDPPGWTALYLENLAEAKIVPNAVFVNDSEQHAGAVVVVVVVVVAAAAAAGAARSWFDLVAAEDAAPYSVTCATGRAWIDDSLT